MSEIDPDALRRVTVFSTCTPEQLRLLAEAATVTEHATGELLAEQGVIGHRFHLLLEGAAEAERDGEVVGTVRAGEFVGEIGLLGGGPATATVRCTEPTRCLTLWREPFWEVLETEPAIALRILEIVCRRIVGEGQAAATQTQNLPS
ncbi:MAG TPA: cyclic nucleotide-binding domain-containing protein [Actinomycetota bacterium]|jgi:CRP-like cAMP-binding protein